MTSRLILILSLALAIAPLASAQIDAGSIAGVQLVQTSTDFYKALAAHAVTLREVKCEDVEGICFCTVNLHDKDVAYAGVRVNEMVVSFDNDRIASIEVFFAASDGLPSALKTMEASINRQLNIPAERFDHGLVRWRGENAAILLGSTTRGLTLSYLWLPKH